MTYEHELTKANRKLAKIEQWAHTTTDGAAAAQVLEIIHSYPKIEPGDRIQYKKTFFTGTRLGAAEPKYVVAVTRQYVVWYTEASNGRYLGERVHGLQDFHETFEKVPDDD